jgi:hypothetical protein
MYLLIGLAHGFTDITYTKATWFIDVAFIVRVKGWIACR